jgi:hypothetical protein
LPRENSLTFICVSLKWKAEALPSSHHYGR